MSEELKVKTMGAVFDVLANNSKDVEEIVARFGGIGSFIKAAPALFRVWRTVADHVKVQGNADDAATLIERQLYYGDQTKDKVKAFQKKYDLDVDGLVGDQTWSKVEDLIK
jgi:peptidoglycan hydrolase-like protein with peptidoglycan-binding domain